MYRRRQKNWVWIAVAGYAVVVLCYLGIARLQYCGYPSAPWLGILLAVIPAVGAYRYEKDLALVGFPAGEKHGDGVLAAACVIGVVAFSWLLRRGSLREMILMVLYYLICVALTEEVVYRGFLQSCLMGLFDMGVSENGCYAVGGLMFALAHILFHIFNYGSVLLALPQLVFAFVFHFAMCRLADKCESIYLPVAIHFAIAYLQWIL